MTKLTEQQITLLRDVVGKRLPNESHLITRAARNTLSREEREHLCAAIGAEFAETGVDKQSEPTARGLELETLLDEINRPNISHPGPKETER
jgi:hypothetical protein